MLASPQTPDPTPWPGGLTRQTSPSPRTPRKAAHERPRRLCAVVTAEGLSRPWASVLLPSWASKQLTSRHCPREGVIPRKVGVTQGPLHGESLGLRDNWLAGLRQHGSPAQGGKTATIRGVALEEAGIQLTPGAGGSTRSAGGCAPAGWSQAAPPHRRPGAEGRPETGEEGSGALFLLPGPASHSPRAHLSADAGCHACRT